MTNKIEGMTNRIKLELCCKADLDRVIEILDATELGEKYFSHNLEKITRLVHHEHSKDQIFVARNGQNEIVGTLFHKPLGAFGNYPYIHMLAVAPSFQNQGFGRQILIQYEEDQREPKQKYFLLVAEWNGRAKKLYETLGYKEVGQLEDFYVEGQVETLMMKA